MAITWPSELPTTPLLQGYSEAIPNNTLRSSVDSGPAKVRRKGGLMPFPMTASMNCTSDQVDALAEFISDTLLEGALRFEWAHPRTKAAIESRFLPNGEKMVDITPLGAGWWFVSFSLEVLP